MSDTKSKPYCAHYEKRVTDVEFVRACMYEKTCEGVANLFGLTQPAVRARAVKLREAGVELPKFPRAVRKPKQVDVTGLNAIVTGESRE